MSHAKPVDDRQLHLFRPRRILPRWIQLPTRTREVVCELLAEMLVEHQASRPSSPQRKEPSRER